MSIADLFLVVLKVTPDGEFSAPKKHGHKIQRKIEKSFIRSRQYY